MYLDGDNIYQHAIVPLQLEGTDSEGVETVIWKNETPNSAFMCRPQALIRGKEDRTLVKYDLSYAEREHAALEASPTTVVSSRYPDTSYNIAHTIIDSMKDLKMKKVASGAGGAPCLLCDSKKNDWVDKETVESGFPINRNAETADQMWKKIVKDKEEGKKTKDRKGQTQEPITASNQEHICVTHSLINVANW